MENQIKSVGKDKIEIVNQTQIEKQKKRVVKFFRTRLPY